MTFNALAAIVDADKTWPETPSLPDALVDVEPLVLAEARSRLARIAQVARALRQVIDDELADKLDGQALRYGDDIIRANNGRGPAKVADSVAWWEFVSSALEPLNQPRRAALLASLYPANSVRLTGLDGLADALEIERDTVRATFIEYESPTSSLSIMHRDRAPKWTHDLEEGEISGSAQT